MASSITVNRRGFSGCLGCGGLSGYWDPAYVSPVAMSAPLPNQRVYPFGALAAMLTDLGYLPVTPEPIPQVDTDALHAAILEYAAERNISGTHYESMGQGRDPEKLYAKFLEVSSPEGATGEAWTLGDVIIEHWDWSGRGAVATDKVSVRTLSEVLWRLAYYDGEIGGGWNDDLLFAMAAWAKDAGLETIPSTGPVDADGYVQLYPANTWDRMTEDYLAVLGQLSVPSVEGVEVGPPILSDEPLPVTPEAAPAPVPREEWRLAGMPLLGLLAVGTAVGIFLLTRGKGDRT